MADLTTLADVKAYLRITNTADDAVLTRLISAASEYIRSWLNRDIDPRTYTEVRDGKGHYKMAFPNYPITGVTSITVDGQTIPQATSSIASGWVLDDTGIMIQLRGCYTFNRGTQNCVIVYAAGYTPIPPDISQACIEMVAYRFKESDRIGVSSKTLAGEVISFSQKDIPANAATLMTQYRRFFTI